VLNINFPVRKKRENRRVPVIRTTSKEAKN